MKLATLAGAVVAACVLMGSAQAEELSGRLKRIKETGTLTLGVRDSSMPFSYIDDKQSYQGYSIDLCMKAATAIQKKLGLASLNVKMVPVNSATRIPLVANGTTDISCDSATNNLERQKQVAFSVTEFITANRFLSRKSANLKTLDDLRGKTVVSSSGTSNIKQITALNNERNLGLNIIAAKDHAEAFLIFETGRAAAFVMDDIILSSLAANSRTPGEFVISADALSVEPYGLILPLGDAPFKKVVDDALINVYKGDEIKRIYARWFQSPIPPKGINLNVSMSPQLQTVLANPTDSGEPSAYAVVPNINTQAPVPKKK